MKQNYCPGKNSEKKIIAKVTLGYLTKCVVASASSNFFGNLITSIAKPQNLVHS
jgi:hypothetical protein